MQSETTKPKVKMQIRQMHARGATVEEIARTLRLARRKVQEVVDEGEKS